MTQTPDSNSDANGVSPPSSDPPPAGTELRESVQDPLDIAMQRADALDQQMLWDGLPTNGYTADDLLKHLRGRAEPWLVEVWNSSPFDTSKPDSMPEPGWRARQRQTAMRERPVVQQETWTSRKLRRDSGDRRTVKQIVAEQRREGR